MIIVDDLKNPKSWESGREHVIFL